MSRRRPNYCLVAFRLTSWIHCPIWSVFIHPLRKLITAVEGHYRLIGHELLPTHVGRIPPLVDRRPGLERPAALPRLAGAPVGMALFAPIDKGPRIRGVMQDLAQGGLRGFAPEQLA